MSSFLFTHILAHWTMRETVPSPQADPDVNQTAHGMPPREWQVMQMHISESRAGATQHCWQNNADRRGAGPHAAFIKQDRDTDGDEQGSVFTWRHHTRRADMQHIACNAVQTLSVLCEITSEQLLKRMHRIHTSCLIKGALWKSDSES